VALALALQAVLGAGVMSGIAETASAAGTGTYRVYQNEKSLKDFASQAQAIAYAKSYVYSHVEKTEGRVWLWDNFPRYKVYDQGKSSSTLEYRTLAEARSAAAKLKFAQIRDLQQPGWNEGTYPRFRLYQGDKTLPNWSFGTLEQAKQAAKGYAGVHIIELSTNQWIWDDMSAAQKAAARAGAMKYSVTVKGSTASSTQYSFLLDAIRASTQIKDSTVVNIATNTVVHTSIPPVTVTQYGKTIKSLYGIGNAVVFAKSIPNAVVNYNGVAWWTNIPYYSLNKDGQLLGYYHDYKKAVALAAGSPGSTVKTSDGRVIWNNVSKLLYMGWNGISRTDTIMTQVSTTQGLDIDSPTWFELAAADGTLTDNSDPALVTKMHNTGIRLMPLVHNQFDAKLTSAFLRNSAAQKKFIDALVNRLAELGVEGVNLDFELMAGGDRARYTAFVEALAKAVHSKGLTISIDLPRGDTSWDHLTAYDHVALAKIVDMVMIMAYDQHWEGGNQIGSVGELGWAEEGVRQFLAYGIPREKLMLGIPFYTRQWRLSSSGNLIDSTAIMMKDIPGIIQATGAQGIYDTKAGQMKYSYYKNGYTYIFWAETPETIKARVDIAIKYDLAGVAAWRLGFEKADLWSMLQQFK